METVALYFLLAAIVVSIIIFAARISPIHPVSITIIPQLLLISFTFTDLRHHLRPFSTLTWVVLIGSMAAFVLGSVLAWVLTRSWKPDRHPSRLVSDPWAVLLVPFALFSIAFLWGFLKTGGIPMFSAHPDILRLTFSSNFVQGWFFAQIITVMSFCLLAFCKGTSRRFKIAAASVCAASLFMYFSTASRGLVLMFILMALTFLDIMVSRVRIKHLFVAFVLLSVVFFGGGYLRYGKTLNYGSSKHVSQLAANFVVDNAYSYSANSFWNLDFALKKMMAERLHVPTYGASTSEGILASAGLLNSLNEAYNWDGAANHEVIMVRGLNSTGYQWALIKDFGIAAPFLWAFLWGLALTATDRYCRLKKPVKFVLIQGQFAYYTFGSFGIFPFSLAITVIGTASTLVFLKLLDSKISQEPEPEPADRKESGQLLQDGLL